MATLIKAECPNCEAEFVVVEDSNQDIDELNCPLCLTEVPFDVEDEDDESEDGEDEDVE